jgi:hypothetical protein
MERIIQKVVLASWFGLESPLQKGIGLVWFRKSTTKSLLIKLKKSKLNY